MSSPAIFDTIAGMHVVNLITGDTSAPATEGVILTTHSIQCNIMTIYDNTPLTEAHPVPAAQILGDDHLNRLIGSRPSARMLTTESVTSRTRKAWIFSAF